MIGALRLGRARAASLQNLSADPPVPVATLLAGAPSLLNGLPCALVPVSQLRSGHRRTLEGITLCFTLRLALTPLPLLLLAVEALSLAWARR